MIVDENFLLRLLVRAEGDHGEAARARVEAARADSALLTVLAATVIEVSVVLKRSETGYGWDRASVADAVEAVLDEPAFDVEHRAALRVAARSYRRRSIDLHDCYLDALARERDTRVLSFDADLRKLGTGERP